MVLGWPLPGMDSLCRLQSSGVFERLRPRIYSLSIFRALLTSYSSRSIRKSYENERDCPFSSFVGRQNFVPIQRWYKQSYTRQGRARSDESSSLSNRLSVHTLRLRERYDNILLCDVALE